MNTSTLSENDRAELDKYEEQLRLLIADLRSVEASWRRKVYVAQLTADAYQQAAIMAENALDKAEDKKP